MHLSIFFVLLLLILGQPTLAETLKDFPTRSIPPKTLTLKPNATEGYAPTLRQPSVINIKKDSTPEQILLPIKRSPTVEREQEPFSAIFPTSIPQIF